MLTSDILRDRQRVTYFMDDSRKSWSTEVEIIGSILTFEATLTTNRRSRIASLLVVAGVVFLIFGLW